MVTLSDNHPRLVQDHTSHGGIWSSTSHPLRCELQGAPHVHRVAFQPPCCQKATIRVIFSCFLSTLVQPIRPAMQGKNKIMYSKGRHIENYAAVSPAGSECLMTISSFYVKTSIPSLTRDESVVWWSNGVCDEWVMNSFLSRYTPFYFCRTPYSLASRIGSWPSALFA